MTITPAAVMNNNYYTHVRVQDGTVQIKTAVVGLR